MALNDVSATGENTFYVTNCHGYPRDHIMAAVSTVVPILSKSSVVYWDGNESHYVILPGDIGFPNGVAMSESGEHVYIADTISGGFLNIYSLKDGNPNDLELEKKVMVGTGIDNLDVHPVDGSIWAGCHPNALRFLRHATDPYNSISPSQVIRIDVSDLDNITVDEIYLNNGDQVPASSTGFPVGKYMIVTPVFADHFALCY